MKVLSMFFLASILSASFFIVAVSVHQNNIPDISKYAMYNIDILRGLGRML